ncbi:MAG TPA: hypothetical protein VN962_00810 [Polyangia bacterium]|nr:hypothetical protein [Polyangia bacterium]
MIGLLIGILLAQVLPLGPEDLMPPPPPEPPRRTHHPRPADLERLRAAFADEPPLVALRQAAVALIMAEPERTQSMLTRARLAGWFPELRLLVERRLNRAESVDLGTAADPGSLAPVGIDTDNDVRYQARASWDLGRIVFNPDEIAVEGQSLRAADARREIEALIIRLYFERRRLKLDSLGADDSDMPSGSRRDLRIAEIEAELDALTGGAFARLARRHPAEGH